MSDEEIGELLETIIADPETRAYTFTAVGPDDEVIAFGESQGDERDYERICATVLIQFAKSSEQGTSEFIKSAVQEFNRRKESAEQRTIENANGGDN